MLEHSFTVPDKSSVFFNQIKYLVSSNCQSFTEDTTKDRLVFSIEFSSESKRKNFIEELNSRFPFINQ